MAQMAKLVVVPLSASRTGVQFQVLAVLLLILLPANVPGKAEIDVPHTWEPTNAMEG